MSLLTFPGESNFLVGRAGISKGFVGVDGIPMSSKSSKTGKTTTTVASASVPKTASGRIMAGLGTVTIGNIGSKQIASTPFLAASKQDRAAMHVLSTTESPAGRGGGGGGGGDDEVPEGAPSRDYSWWILGAAVVGLGYFALKKKIKL